jgi:uncharacterized protein YkwD
MTEQEPMVATTQTLRATRSRRIDRRGGRVLTLAFGLASILMATLSPALAYGWDNYSFNATAEDKLVTLINQARASAGLPALNDNAALHDVARWRSKDMWDRNYFSHTIPSPPGGNVFDELHRRGICYTVAGENIGEIMTELELEFGAPKLDADHPPTSQTFFCELVGMFLN